MPQRSDAAHRGALKRDGGGDGDGDGKNATAPDHPTPSSDDDDADACLPPNEFNRVILGTGKVITDTGKGIKDGFQHIGKAVTNIGGRAGLPTEKNERGRKYHRVDTTPSEGEGEGVAAAAQQRDSGDEGDANDGQQPRQRAIPETEDDTAKQPPRDADPPAGGRGDGDGARTAKGKLTRRGGERAGKAPKTKAATRRDNRSNVIVLPPLLEFIVRDSTLLATTGLVASILLHVHWAVVYETRSLPFPVAGAFAVFAFFLGHVRTVETDLLFALEVELGEERALAAVWEQHERDMALDDDTERDQEEEAFEIEELERKVGKVNASIVAELHKSDIHGGGGAADAAVAGEGGGAKKSRRERRRERRRKNQKPNYTGQQAPRQQTLAGGQKTRVSQARRHSVFVLALEKVTNKQVVFQEEAASMDEEEETTAHTRVENLPPGFWTALLDMPEREQEGWEVHANDTCEKLMTRLLKDPGEYRRTGTGDAEVVVPVTTFRGMDVFHSDVNEAELSKRTILEECGLRDKPVAMVHLLSPFASIVVYFELPAWVDDPDGLEERDGDADDVLAVKRFIKGDAEYRNKRLKIYPVLNKGPIGIRMLFYPPSKEFCIWGTMLPLAWYDQKPVAASAHGPRKSRVVEACVDVVSSAIARSTSQLFGGSLKNIEMDIAIVIGTPDGQEKKEPEACIGMYRLDHIDLHTCPRLPPKTRTESIMEASELRSTLGQISVAV